MHGSLPEVVISKSVSIANSVISVTRIDYFIGKTVEDLEEDLLKFALEVLNATKPPESIIWFLTGLLKRHRHGTSKNPFPWLFYTQQI